MCRAKIHLFCCKAFPMVSGIAVCLAAGLVRGQVTYPQSVFFGGFSILTVDGRQVVQEVNHSGSYYKAPATQLGATSADLIRQQNSQNMQRMG